MIKFRELYIAELKAVGFFASDAENLADVIARGKVVKGPIEPDKIYIVTETAYAVVIPLNQSQRRMLTMYEPKPNSRKLAEIKKYPPAPKRQGR